jgi:hypothetical protein
MVTEPGNSWQELPGSFCSLRGGRYVGLESISSNRLSSIQ